MLPSFFLQRCSLQPQFAPGSGSTSQPLLLQSLAFSLGFCLQCGSLSPRNTPPPPFSAVSAPFTGVWLEGQSGGVNIWHCLCSSVFVHTSKNVCVCSAWHLSHHLHLPPRYPACFCRLRRQPPHRQLPQPFFLDLTPETPLPPFVSQLLNIWD